MPTLARFVRSGRCVALPAVILLTAALTPIRTSAQAVAAAPARPTLEWIFSDNGRALTALPSTAWLADGTALYFDPRPARAERHLERLDPATGRRTPALDQALALKHFAVASPGSQPDVLEWPDAIDPTGRRVFYTLDDDVFAVELATATVRRLTKTPAEEKNLQVSPDGARLAFVRDNDLYAIELTTGTESRLTTDGSATRLNGTLSWVYWEEIFGRRDLAYWWAPDGHALAYLQSDESAVSESTFVDFRPWQPAVVLQRYPRAGATNPAVRVGVVAATGGETRWVAITDRPFEYVLRVAWLPDSARVSVQTLTRDQHELGLYFASAATGAATRILTETDPGWVNVTDDLRFLPRLGQFLWASERDGFMHLYRYRLDGTLVNTVTAGDYALASADDAAYWVRQAVAGVDEKAGVVYVASLKASSVERQLYKVRLDGSGLTRVSTGAGTHSVSMSPDTRFYFDAFSDTATLPSLALRRSDGSLVPPVLAPPLTDRVQPFDLVLPTLTTIPASDGFAMPALLYRPRVPAGQRVPVIMYVYGGPSAPTVKNAWQDYTLYYQSLLEAGYAVVEVDNRAATAISKRLENTLLGTVGRSDTADLVDAARWLKQQPWVDPARLGVFGWSGGGTMTLNLLTRSEEFKAGISIAPVTDWRYYDSKWAEAFMKRPDDRQADYDAFSLVGRASHLHGRLLLVYGTADDNVHPQNEQAFIDALIRAGITFDTAIYPMRKHGIGDDPARVHLFRTMIEFWKMRL